MGREKRLDVTHATGIAGIAFVLEPFPIERSGTCR